MSDIEIGSRRIGGAAPPLLVAEIGINHNGDAALAARCIDAAADAGADAVKFQNYRTEDFVADRSLTIAYEHGERRIVESQYDLFKRCELAPTELAALKAHADARGAIFHSTPTSEAGIADLLRLGVCVLKNGSDYLTHLPLIEAMGRTGLPTVLSTGMATLAEIDDAVRAFRGTGNDRLVLLHCTSSYPTPPHDANLRRIETLRRAFGCPVGFSDHTDGVACAIASAALGACWIEKHFTLDKSLPGPDHRFSADAEEFAELAAGVRTAWQALGSPDITPVESEATGRRDFRLSCVAARSLPAGHVVAEQDVAFRRPGTGLTPSERHRLVGRALRAPVATGRVLQQSDVE